MTINQDSSLQYVIRQLFVQEATVEQVLEWMKYNGSSVLLNWGEDDDCWECSWITGGIRFTGCQSGMIMAIAESLNKLFSSNAANRIGKDTNDAPPHSQR